ncbi:MAG: ribonuclease P protein component [Oscillospiraceae bacterium]|nr:ribonuclease P protein component [Oscillospiraceae bacterium]
MKNTVSLKLNKDFKRLYYKGKSVSGGYVVVYTMKNRLGINRLGLTAGKVVGNAVSRNRVKRLMRESYRLMEDRLETGFDIVIVSRSRAPLQSCDKIMKDTEFAMKKLGLFKTI